MLECLKHTPSPPPPPTEVVPDFYSTLQKVSKIGRVKLKIEPNICSTILFIKLEYSLLKIYRKYRVAICKSAN